MNPNTSIRFRRISNRVHISLNLKFLVLNNPNFRTQVIKMAAVDEKFYARHRKDRKLPIVKLLRRKRIIHENLDHVKI